MLLSKIICKGNVKMLENSSDLVAKEFLKVCRNIFFNIIVFSDLNVNCFLTFVLNLHFIMKLTITTDILSFSLNLYKSYVGL